jgi:hypothetical protein
MKAAWNAYLEAQLPLLKAEHPGLRLSQLRERIFEAWQKARATRRAGSSSRPAQPAQAPDNPKNQPHLDYNSKGDGTE